MRKHLRPGRPRKLRVHILNMPGGAVDRVPDSPVEIETIPDKHRKTGLDRGYRKVYCGEGIWKRVGWIPPLATKSVRPALAGSDTKESSYQSDHADDRNVRRVPVVPRRAKGM
jgi:hypothetical protein